MEKERHYFVWFIAALLVGATGYYGYTSWEKALKPKIAEGEKVYASIDGYDLTESKLHEAVEEMNDSNYYQAWRNAVINESLNILSDEDKDLVKNYVYQLKSQAISTDSDNWESTLKTTIATEGTTDLDTYGETKMKSQRLVGNYVKEHVAEYEDKLNEIKPRKISMLVMEDTEDNAESIKKAEEELQKEDFGKVVDKYDKDGGYYKNLGYMDTVLLSQTGWDEAIITAITELTDEKQISDWVSIPEADANTQSSSPFAGTKVKIQITDVGYEKNTDEEDMYSNAVTDTSEVEKIIYEYAKKLDITYASDDIKDRINKYRLDTYGIEAEKDTNNTEDSAKAETEEKKDEGTK